MEAKCALVLFGALLFARSGNAQCDQNITIGGGLASVAQVNTTIVPTCFNCVLSDGVSAAIPVTFSVDRTSILNSSFVTISGHQLIVSNFTDLSLNDGTANGFECIDSNAIVLTRMVTTLNPIQPEFQIPPPDFFVEGSLARIACLNRNAAPFMGSTFWLDAMGMEASSIGVLQFGSISRSQAGLYTCQVRSDKQVPYLSFDLVVHYLPDVNTTNSNLEFFDLASTLTLTSTFDGIPTPSVQWMHNGLAIDSSNDSVTITTSNTTSVLEWVDVTTDAVGNFLFVAANNLGLRNLSIAVMIRTPPEPATGFEAQNVTETTIEIFWIKQSDGLSPITGANLHFFLIGSSDPADMITTSINGINITSFVIMGLDSFAYYNISLAVVNRIGPSETVFFIQRTLSLFLDPPTVTLNALSSTVMQVSWTPSTSVSSTEDAFYWMVEFSRIDGTDPRSVTVENSTTDVQFMGLDKGMIYMTRVAGNNSRGFGNFSEFVNRSTNVDPPSAPTNISAEGLSSFAINSTWMLPDDNGGRPVTGYQASIFVDRTEASIISESVNIINEPFHFVNDMVLIMPSQQYTVSVRALNTMGLGEAADINVTTRNISEPQAILEPIFVEIFDNVSITLAWDYPGGDVLVFIIVYIERVEPMREFNVSVNGTETNFTLIDLEPSTTYGVTIITENDFGMSAASPVLITETAPPPRPRITVSPPGPYQVGDVLVLTCTSPHNKPVKWTRLDGRPLESPMFEQMGGNFRKTLTFMIALVADGGVYDCHVGENSDNVTITVITPTTISSPKKGISGTVIAISSCLGGGLFIVLIIIIVITVILLSMRKKPANYDLKPSKRGKELFEVSNNFTPTTNTGITRNTDVSFNMPSEYQEHSSFDTLEKNLERSHSPEAINPSSFGGGLARGSTDCLVEEKQGKEMFQDQPPTESSNDGAML